MKSIEKRCTRKDRTIKGVCKKCKSDYIVRNDNMRIWNPSISLPVSTCAYTEIKLCPKCRKKLISFIKKFIKNHAHNSESE